MVECSNSAPSIMIKASEFVFDAFYAFVTRSLYNLGEDFSSLEKSSQTVNHEKSPLPLGVLLMFAGLIATGACVANVFLAFWYYFLGVVPTRIMVLSHSQDSREERPEPKIWHVRWQISQFRFNLLESSNRNVIRGALYAFFMSSWLSDVIAWPFSPGLHRSVVYVLAALLLCPLHFIATGLSIKSPPLFSPPRAPGIWQGSEKGEKAPAPPTVEEPVPRWSTLLYDLYCWLLPTTLLWATACELAKLPPLTLSRAYSLKERVQSMVVLYDLSGPSLRTLLLDSALVFLVYLAACLLLILPTTIAMRRVHASLARFSKAVVPPDEMIRGRTELVEKKYLGAFEALRTFSLRQLPRMMLICGTVYCVMQAIKLIGLGMLVLGFKLMENMYGSTEQYLGFGETFVWYFQRAVFGS